MSVGTISKTPLIQADHNAAEVSSTMLTLPSGRKIPIQFLVQTFLAELIRLSEQQITSEQAELEVERSWKEGIDAARKVELSKIRKEAENLNHTGKVREYGLGGMLALSGVAASVGGNLLLGGAGIVAGVMQMLNQYFEQRGTDAAVKFFNSFLPVGEER